MKLRWEREKRRSVKTEKRHTVLVTVRSLHDRLVEHPLASGEVQAGTEIPGGGSWGGGAKGRAKLSPQEWFLH